MWGSPGRRGDMHHHKQTSHLVNHFNVRLLPDDSLIQQPLPLSLPLSASPSSLSLPFFFLPYLFMFFFLSSYFLFTLLSLFSFFSHFFLLYSQASLSCCISFLYFRFVCFFRLPSLLPYLSSSISSSNLHEHIFFFFFFNICQCLFFPPLLFSLIPFFFSFLFLYP